MDPNLWLSVTKNIRSPKGTKWVFWVIVFCEFASYSGYLNWYSKQSSKQQASLRLEKVRSSALKCWGSGVCLRKAHFTILCDWHTVLFYCWWVIFGLINQCLALVKKRIFFTKDAGIDSLAQGLVCGIRSINWNSERKLKAQNQTKEDWEVIKLPIHS